MERIGHLISFGSAQFITKGDIPLEISTDEDGTYSVTGLLFGEIVDVEMWPNEQSHVVGKINASIIILGIFKPSSCSIEIEAIKEEWLPGGNFTVTVAGISVNGTWEELGLSIDSDTFAWRDLQFPYGVGEAENYPKIYDAGNINWVETWKITQLTVEPPLNCTFDYSEE